MFMLANFVSGSHYWGYNTLFYTDIDLQLNKNLSNQNVSVCNIDIGIPFFKIEGCAL